jgi:hypothetical protein
MCPIGNTTKIRPVRAQLIRADRQTDGRKSMTKLVSAFHDYTRKAPKKNHIISASKRGWTNYNYHDLPRRAPSVVHKEELIENRCLTSYPQLVKHYDNGSRRTFVLTSVTSASTQLLIPLWVWLYLSDVTRGEIKILCSLPMCGEPSHCCQPTQTRTQP